MLQSSPVGTTQYVMKRAHAATKVIKLYVPWFPIRSVAGKQPQPCANASVSFTIGVKNYIQLPFPYLEVFRKVTAHGQLQHTYLTALKVSSTHCKRSRRGDGFNFLRDPRKRPDQQHDLEIGLHSFKTDFRTIRRLLMDDQNWVSHLLARGVKSLDFAARRCLV